MSKRSVDANEKMVVITCDVSKGRGAEKVTLVSDHVHTLDFSKVPEDVILDLAASSIVIKLQASWRDLTPKQIKEDLKTDVQELLTRTIERKVDPAKSVLRAVENGKLTGAELEKLIAELNAKVSK